MFQITIPIVMFDIFENDFRIGMDAFLEFDEEKQEEMTENSLDQANDLGYDSHNGIILLGTMAILYFLYFIKLFIFVIAMICYKFCSGKCKDIGRKIY